MKILQYLPITMVYMGFKRFFDILIHIATINIFVEGVRKWLRADCNKKVKKKEGKIPRFFGFLTFLQVWRQFYKQKKCANTRLDLLELF